MVIMSSRNGSDINDIVKEVVQTYLRRRNYHTVEGGAGEAARAELTQSLHEMAADGLAEAAASVANTMAYTAATLEPAAAESQFARFRAWVLDSPDPYQSTLQKLLFPVFVNLHLELVLGGHSPARFYSRHHGPFMSSPERRSLAADLAAVNTRDDLERSRFRNFRSSRPEVALSDECAEYLRRALRSPQLALVLHMLSQHVTLTAAAEPAGQETEPGRPGRRRLSTGSQRGAAPSAADADPAGQLQQAIARLRAEPPPPPTVCAYRVSRTLACAALAPRLPALAAGRESGADVWALAPDGLANAANPAARVPLAADDGGEPAPRRERAPSRPLRGHCGAVYSLAFEPEGEALLSAGEDTTLRAWRTDSWANVSIYRGHTYPVWSVACQPAGGGQFFVSGSMDRTTRLWSFDRTHQLRIFAGHSQDVDCVAFHPNGKYVGSASGDGTVRLWTVTDAAQVRVLSGHHGVVHGLQFSPDGKQLAAAGEDHHVRVYDLGTGSLVHDLSAHMASVGSVLWTPGGRTLVSADRDGAINTWNLQARSETAGRPASTFVCPGWSTVSLHYAPHNYLVAVFGQQDD